MLDYDREVLAEDDCLLGEDCDGALDQGYRGGDEVRLAIDDEVAYELEETLIEVHAFIIEVELEKHLVEVTRVVGEFERAKPVLE